MARDESVRLLEKDELRTADFGFLEFRDHIMPVILQGRFNKAGEAQGYLTRDADGIPHYLPEVQRDRTWRIWNRQPTRQKRAETAWASEYVWKLYDEKERLDFIPVLEAMIAGDIRVAIIQTGKREELRTLRRADFPGTDAMKALIYLLKEEKTWSKH